MAGRQVRRGTNAQRVALGGASVAEFIFETDTKDLYIGAAGGDHRIPSAGDINALQTLKVDTDAIPYIRPEDYGEGIGEGHLDDRDIVAIQAATDYLDANRGGTLCFFPKIYNQAAKWNLKSNIRYLGHAQMNPTGSELPVSGTVLKWIGVDGGTMAEAFAKTGILWDGINLYGKQEAGDDPIENGIIGIRQYSVNDPIAWRNKFRNFEAWHLDTAMDFGHHTIGYESDMYEISDFNFYKVNTGIRSSSTNGSQGSIIKNGRIHPYDRGIWAEHSSLLKISQITFGSLSDAPTHGNFIEVYEVGGQLIIEGCQGEGYDAWNSIKFTLPYSYSAERPTVLLANTFNAPVVVAGAYDIISIGNTYHVQASQLDHALDFSGNGINYTSIGDTFATGNLRRDTGAGNFFGVMLPDGSMFGQIAGPALVPDSVNGYMNALRSKIAIRPAANVIAGLNGIIGTGPNLATHPTIGPTAYMAGYNEGANWWDGTALAFFTHSGPNTTDPADPADERMRIKSDGIVNIINVPNYANNAAAVAGGLVSGDLYSVTGTDPLQLARVI